MNNIRKRIVTLLLSIPLLFSATSINTAATASVESASGDRSCLSTEDTIGENNTKLSGIFIVPELTSDATAEEWKASLQNMKEIGIDFVILQYIYQTDSMNGDQAYFPYWQEDTVTDASEYPLRRSQAEYILAAAKEAGLQVYVGLQLSEREWFDENAFQSYDWLYNQYWLANDLANSFWDCFGQEYSDLIAGWYLPFEFESTPEYYDYFSQITSIYYAPLTQSLKNDTRFENHSIMISPLMYANDDKEAWNEHLEIILSKSLIDIVAPQDGIGYGTQTHETVGDWYQSTRLTIDDINQTYQKNIALWGNCENYATLRNPDETDPLEYIKPMSNNKFIKSLKTASPYVDNLITFSIHRWDTSMYYNHQIGVNDSYYNAYKNFYLTGKQSPSKTNGYYVSIKSTDDQNLIFNDYADAGLTDGLADGSGSWSQYKGISSASRASIMMEIKFDDPTEISSIKSNYYQDTRSGIGFPKEIQYEYLVRTGANNEINNYTLLGIDYPNSTTTTYASTVFSSEPVMVDGIRITVTPANEWIFIDDIWVE